MSSDRTLANVRATLRDTIKPLIPTRWRIVPNADAAETLSVPALYLVFETISTEVEGSPLPRGRLLSQFAATVLVPGTDVKKTEDAVDAAVLALIEGLEAASDVAFGPTATKFRDETSGQLGWRIPVAVVTTHTVS